MLIDIIAGTRLDLYRIAPVLNAVSKEQDAGKDIGYRFIYTGTKKEFEAGTLADMPIPGIFLDVEEEHDAASTATTLTRYERLIKADKPEIVLIFGHSNGAMACTLAAAKIQGLKIAHIGSGLRNYNRNGGDEVNRRLIDSITDYHFTIAQSSGENLRNEGVPDDFIFLVGNPVADFLNKRKDAIPSPAIWELLQLNEKKYILLQLSHPLVAGSTSRMKNLLLHIIRLSKNLPIVLISNPVSGKTLAAIGIKAPNLHIINEPDIDTLYYLAQRAKVVVTDTQKLQDETTIMQVPCITLLKSEAVPDTYSGGFNEITGLQTEALSEAFHKLFQGDWKKGRIPYLWDGKAAERIVSVLRKLS